MRKLLIGVSFMLLAACVENTMVIDSDEEGVIVQHERWILGEFYVDLADEFAQVECAKHNRVAVYRLTARAGQYFGNRHYDCKAR